MTIVYTENNINNILRNYNFNVDNIVENYSREDLRNMYLIYVKIKWNKNFTKKELVERMIKAYNQKQLQKQKDNNNEIYDITK